MAIIALSLVLFATEFSLANGQNLGVEWYESASARPDYSFDTPAPSSSAANYGTFDDEPPLLEGTLQLSVVPHRQSSCNAASDQLVI